MKHAAQEEIVARRARVLDLIAQGQCSKRIARAVGTSVPTVEHIRADERRARGLAGEDRGTLIAQLAAERAIRLAGLVHVGYRVSGFRMVHALDERPSAELEARRLGGDAVVTEVWEKRT